MNIIYRVSGKIRHSLHHYILRYYGYLIRGKKVWDSEFSRGVWDWENKDEEGRYHAIIKYYSHYSPRGQILDVGCGTGTLYRYFKQDINISSDKYMGIDFSETAVKQASKRFPRVTFSHLDFDKSPLNKKFDTIIFNEALYYFNWPVKTLQKCQRFNLNKGGQIIISMVDNNANSRIWKQIEKYFKVRDEKGILNEKNHKWNIKVLIPKG